MNFTQQIESFDIKINCFGCQNRCQQYFSLSTARIWWHLSFFSLTRDWKTIQINFFFTKSDFKKKRKGLNCINCIIFKVWGTKCIYCQISCTPSKFGAVFFFLSSFNSIITWEIKSFWPLNRIKSSK